MTWLRLFRKGCFVEIAAVRIHHKQGAFTLVVENLRDYGGTGLGFVFSARCSVLLIVDYPSDCWVHLFLLLCSWA